MSARVALVLVSHSAQVATGTAAIAEQMAPDVLLLPAGGTPDGIGTSVDLVLEAVEHGLAQTDGDGGGVVVLTDLGSALLTTDLVLEMVDEPGRVAVPSAPFVEGAVSAAVKAQQGGDLAAVAAAAREAMHAPAVGGSEAAAAQPEAPAPATAPAAGSAEASDDEVVMAVTVRNPLGLHARPAALVARAVADSGARVTIDGSDASSVLALMALAATAGREVTVRAVGPGAAAAAQRVVAMIDEGFGEV